MAISSISGSIPSQAQQYVEKTSKSLQTALASLISGKRVNQASDDITALSIASKLQSETSGLRQISNNLAQVSSLAQVADGGVEQIQNLLGKLGEVAQQAASPTVNADQRAALNQQFKQLSSEINRFTENTSFGNKKLLDGSISGDNSISLNRILDSNSESDGGSTFNINSLSTTSLFGGKNLDILSVDGANEAIDAVSAALGKVTQTRAGIGAFQQATNYAAANIDSVFSNLQAASSVLSDTDFAQASTNASLANIQNNAALALLAQGNRLTPALLKLVS